MGQTEAAVAGALIVRISSVIRSTGASSAADASGATRMASLHLGQRSALCGISSGSRTFAPHLQVTMRDTVKNLHYQTLAVWGGRSAESRLRRRWCRQFDRADSAVLRRR